jgi:hypothetical protein
MRQASHQVSFGFNEQTFPPGLHICYLYNNENERRRTIAEFIQSGLIALPHLPQMKWVTVFLS